MQSTIKLFWHLCDSLPPLFPPEAAGQVKNELVNLSQRSDITLAEIENSMIKFGYVVWPWHQAYKYFLAAVEEKTGEHFLLPKLTPELRRRYEDFQRYGGVLRELHSGRPADFFSGEERADLCAALVETQLELKAYVNNDVASVRRGKYLKRVAEFSGVLEEIAVNLERMNELASAEQDHPALADQIRSQVRAFEYGLCFLGPEIGPTAVCQSVEYFAGRKDELNRLRGIHREQQINF